MLINRDDRVVYTGQKFAKDLSGKIGFVVGPVDKDPGVWVVDFPEDSYIMSERLLEKYRAPVKDDGAPEVHTRRKRKLHDEET
jgi:hypothetical protein